MANYKNICNGNIAEYLFKNNFHCAVKTIVFIHDHWDYDDVVYHLASNFGLEFKNAYRYYNGRRCVVIAQKSIDDMVKLDTYLKEYAEKNNQPYYSLFRTDIDLY